MISQAEYEHSGGFRDAINSEANTVLAEFPNEHKAIKRLFQRITEKGEGDKPIRKPETLSVLAELTGLEPRRLGEIVAAFEQRGLLVTRQLETGETEADLPHECVGWKWDVLKKWIHEEAASANSLKLLKTLTTEKQPLTGTVLSGALRLNAEGRLEGSWARRYLSQTDLSSIVEWVAKSEKREKVERLRLIRTTTVSALAAVVMFVLLI